MIRKDLFPIDAPPGEAQLSAQSLHSTVWTADSRVELGLLPSTPHAVRNWNTVRLLVPW